MNKKTVFHVLEGLIVLCWLSMIGLLTMQTVRPSMNILKVLEKIE